MRLSFATLCAVTFATLCAAFPSQLWPRMALDFDPKESQHNCMYCWFNESCDQTSKGCCHCCYPFKQDC
ncbi:hypothetical protein CLAFUW4_01968 [Fulvia fulva]|uniref:Putative effector 21 n=1 Tax=Passalora fulva TaxID=5499 RepID=A0A1P8YXJ3_PASFU|nr:uncharacterized protein CLAFUR5_01962 [Fulvia fulva]AQA29224.1 putative effector 21 [Fulvia fulva]KAK4634096.1 hypothetical protein CLAFUR4_01963 [Fulvia fulva]KAK4637586.1 hypothetical protein CLAFUR0_01965 [Fulvia fulva]UJO12379.1 hypothetical protein CLAFUR5_01962 [Fulvia fulva]WPV08542.1 hypothetical protein CLAFUW4_01968 [Fulvia fulva]